MLIQYSRKLLALLLAVSLLLMGTTVTAFSEEGAQPSAEQIQAETTEPTQAPTQEPTKAPTATPTVKPTEEPTVAPTPEQTAEPTPAAEPTEEATKQPDVTEAVTESPLPEATAEPTVEPEETEPVSTEAVPTATPVPTETIAEVAFSEGMVWLEKGAMLYADPKCTESLATVLKKGAVYASVDESAIAAKLTLDGETVTDAYLDENSFTPLTDAEMAEYRKQESEATYQGLPLLALAVETAAQETEPSATPEPDAAFTEGLARLAAGTVIYEDAILLSPLATLVESGVVYATVTEDTITAVFTLDGVTLQQGYLTPNDYSPLTEAEAAEYAAQSSELTYHDLPIFILVTTAEAKTVEATQPEVLPLARLAAGMELYSDKGLSDSVGVLAADGIVYVGDGFILYTLDGNTVATGYIDAEPALLNDEEIAQNQSLEGGVVYENAKLFPLELAQNNYTLDTYGFTGMDTTLSSDKISEKQNMVASGAMSDFKQMVSDKDYVEGEIFVYASSEAEANKVAASYDATVIDYYGEFGFALLKLTGGHTTAQAMTAAADEKTSLYAAYINGIRYLEEPHENAPEGTPTKSDILTLDGASAPTLGTWETMKTNDPFLQYPDSKTHLLYRYKNITSGYQYMHDVVGTYAAWGLTKGSSAVKVFVLDSGVLASHEDLATVVNIAPSGGASSSITGDSTMNPHGTHVAGIIAATANNGKGGAGIAPNVTIQACRADGTGSAAGSFTSASVCTALSRAISNGAYVVNMSIGGLWYNSAEDTAVQSVLNNGIPIFAAEGNDGMQTYDYPAHYSGVISVASTDNNNTRSFYSTYAAATISAPGSNILSTAWASGSTPTTTTYQAYDGTSMACPVATGCAALYYSARGTRDLNGDGSVNRADVTYLQKVFTSNATKIVGKSTGMGAGIINIGKVFLKMAGKPTLTFSADVTDKNYVSPESHVIVTCGWNGQYIVYTTDGSTPKVKNGEVTNGTAVYGSKSSGATTFSTNVSLSNLSAGSQKVRAISVNAQGVSSSVATLSFTINDITPSSIAITTASNVVAKGKYYTYKATVTPASKLSPKWEIVSGSQYATISSTSGKLKGVATGTAVIRAYVVSTTGSTIYSSNYTVNIVADAVSSITFASKTVYLNVGGTYQLSPTILLTNGSTITHGSRPYLCSSSKTSVATVNTTGKVTANAPGTAKITYAIQDGSGKKGYLNVTIRQPVTGITITGYTVYSDGKGRIASGKSQYLKADVQPSSASNKKVAWSVDATSQTRGISISSSGKLYVPSSVTSGTITVTCAATDGSGISRTAVFTITPVAITSITLNSSDSRVTRSSSGTLNGGYVYTSNVPGTTADDTTLQLTSSVSSVPVQWSSSNTRVMTVSSTGLVSAEATGSAKITCKVMDGSNKSASVTLKAIVPASNINVYTDSSKLYNPYPSIAFGKSRSFKATVGSTYGKPGVTKVKWSYEFREYNGSAGSYLYDMENASYFTKITNTSITQYVKISSSGNVSVSKSLQNIWVTVSGEYYVKIIATATDGSGVVGYTYAQLTSQSYANALPSSFTVYRLSGSYLYYYGTASYDKKVAKDDYDRLYFAGSSYNGDFGATSSKPSVASPIDSVSRVGITIGSTTYAAYVRVGSTFYPLYVIYYKGDKAGSATIKVFTNDGTNKSASFSVKVTD